VNGRKQANLDALHRLILQFEETKGRELAFQEAARWGLLEHVVRLHQAGVDVNCRSPDGGTALMLAAFASKPEIVRYLLQHEADATLRTATGQTALQAAVGGLMPEGGVLKVVRMLLEAGADPSVADEAGPTPYSLAKSKYSEKVWGLLRPAAP